jgi:hypothetical protein
MNTHKHTLGSIVLVLLLTGVAVLLWMAPTKVVAPDDITFDSMPQQVTLTGTYVCLPHTAGSPPTDECAFGVVTDDGTYYAVNFGASADAMSQFMSGARITAEGNIVMKEALSSDHWTTYDMRGIFTVTRMLDVSAPLHEPMTDPVLNGKIDSSAVCEGALAYMTFTDGAAAERFVSACKEGKHPEVLEHFKADMDLGNGAAL